MMSSGQKKILLIDETSFSRVCSAILASQGFGTHTLSNEEELTALVDRDDVGLIVTSYPYGAFLFTEMWLRHIPTIILSDHLDSGLIDILEAFHNSYCMIKPLDYRKFKSVVRQVMSGNQTSLEGYRIV
jgi:DNA-binding NtrC family response regulator